jgi:hypothetical protein
MKSEEEDTSEAIIRSDSFVNLSLHILLQIKTAIQEAMQSASTIVQSASALSAELERNKMRKSEESSEINERIYEMKYLKKEKIRKKPEIKRPSFILFSEKRANSAPAKTKYIRYPRRRVR